MKIIADINIPLLDQLFIDYDLEQLPSHAINCHTLRQADILLCRSVTKVNEKLLAGTSVRYVATATSGSDHFDKPWLATHGIQWDAAPQCNAQSVANYVVCVIASLRKQGLLKGNSAGVIGCGHIGKRVTRNLQQLGFSVKTHDPPRAKYDPSFTSIPLNQMTHLDLICLHADLVTSGPYPSYHLIDASFLQHQQAGTVLLNAARGALVNTQALKKQGKHLIWSLDVYENEPRVDLNLVAQAKLATPHIAGHAIGGKWRGAEKVYQSTLRFLGLTPAKQTLYPITPPILTLPNSQQSWEDIVLAIYNPQQDSQTMKARLRGNPNQTANLFAQLRNEYPVHHEFDYPQIKGGIVSRDDKTLLRQLGIQFIS